jgi:prevent-host-death family protein
MKTYSVYEAKSNFSRLIKEALAGEKIIISSRGLPVIEFTPLATTKLKKRKLGTVKGRWFMSDDFDDVIDDFKEYL